MWGRTTAELETLKAHLNDNGIGQETTMLQNEICNPYYKDRHISINSEHPLRSSPCGICYMVVLFCLPIPVLGKSNQTIQVFTTLLFGQIIFTFRFKGSSPLLSTPSQYCGII